MDEMDIEAVALAFEDASKRFTLAAKLGGPDPRFALCDLEKGDKSDLNNVAISWHTTQDELNAAVLRVRLRAAIEAYEQAKKRSSALDALAAIDADLI